MTSVLDRLRRQAVDKPTNQGTPPDPAPISVRAFRYRRIAGGALVAALVAGAAAAPYLLPDWPSETPTALPAATSASPSTTAPSPAVTRTANGDRPVDLPGNWVIAGAFDPASSLVLDRQRDRYVTINRGEVLPAPNGGQVAWISEDVVQIADLAGTVSRQIPLPNATQPQWSPSGDRLLLTVWRKPDGHGFVVVDVTTGRHTTHWVDYHAYRCNDHCFFRWHRNGREVGFPLTDTASGHSEDQPDAQRGIQLFDATSGAPTRFLPAKGAFHGPYAWSPDGTRVVVDGVTTADGRRTRQTQIFDARTGEMLTTLPYPTAEVWWATDDQLFVHTDSTVVAIKPDGTVTEVIQLGGALLGTFALTLSPR